MIPANTG